MDDEEKKKCFQEKVEGWKEFIEKEAVGNDPKRPCLFGESTSSQTQHIPKKFFWEKTVPAAPAPVSPDSTTHPQTVGTVERFAGVAPDCTTETSGTHSKEESAQANSDISAVLQTDNLFPSQLELRSIEEKESKSKTLHQLDQPTASLLISGRTDSITGTADTTTAEVVSHLEKKIEQQAAQIKDYKEALEKKSLECRLLMAESKRLNLAGRNTKASMIAGLSSNALSLLRGIELLASGSFSNTEQNNGASDLELENLNLKNVITELIGKIRSLKGNHTINLDD